MSRAALLKRLGVLEASVSVTPVQRLAFVEVHKLADADRDAHWSGDASVIDGYRDPDARTIVVDLHPDVRESWLETWGMTESEIEAYASEQDRREAVERAAAMRNARPVVPPESENRPPAVWGWAADGTPIYDNDPRFRDAIDGPA